MSVTRRTPHASSSSFSQQYYYDPRGFQTATHRTMGASNFEITQGSSAICHAKRRSTFNVQPRATARDSHGKLASPAAFDFPDFLGALIPPTDSASSPSCSGAPSSTCIQCTPCLNLIARFTRLFVNVLLARFLQLCCS